YSRLVQLDLGHGRARRAGAGRVSRQHLRLAIDLFRESSGRIARADRAGREISRPREAAFDGFGSPRRRGVGGGMHGDSRARLAPRARWMVVADGWRAVGDDDRIAGVLRAPRAPRGESDFADAFSV